jgi:hypothetical protein
MVCFCAAGGCLIVAWLRGLQGASIGAAGPFQTSCPRCRGSYREGFSHWCRSRSLNPDIATGARPSRNTRPGLRSRPLGRRSGCSSAEPYPPPRPLLIEAVVLSHNLWHHANDHSSAVSRPCYKRDVSMPVPHAAKPLNTVPFPLISIGGTGTRPPKS